MYKAFNKNLQCYGFQFEIGKEYEIEGELKICENGFHLCKNMQDCFEYYSSNSRICEVEPDVVITEGNKSATNKIKIIRELSREEIVDRINDSKYAYLWVRYIGDREIMIDRITDSKYAYWWAIDIGDREVMIDRVTDSEYAYWWARYIGDREIMIDRITDSKYAYLWAKYIGDQEVMTRRFPEILKNF